jgi:hypothetical protein
MKVAGFFLAFLMLGSSVFAQPVVRGQKKTTLNFEDEIIRGRLNQPELIYLVERKELKFKNFLQLRKDFAVEFQWSLEELPGE